jgi:glycosyltransferase involved in cell wall biosynthesis
MEPYLKVLHVLNAIEFSGAEVMLRIAAPRFIASGITLHVLSTGEDVGAYARELANAGYAVHHIPFGRSLSYFRNIYHLMVKHRFDVVHIHPERAFFWHALVAKIAGVRIVLRSVHNVFLFNGYLRFKRALQRWASSHLLGIEFISVGPSVAEVELKVFHNHTHLIRNWVDQTEFRPAKDESERRELRGKYGFSPADVVLVSVGACTTQKNHAAIMYAVAEIQESDANIVYLHVGEGPLLQEEMETTKSTGVLECVRFIPQTRFVRDILVASDIFVMSSTHEGLSISSIEAMSCGLPIVAYDVYGLRDVVENGKTGFLTEPSPKALAESIKKLVVNEPLRNTMAKEAQVKATRNFSTEKSISELLLLYQGAETL